MISPEIKTESASDNPAGISATMEIKSEFRYNVEDPRNTLMGRLDPNCTRSRLPYPGTVVHLFSRNGYKNEETGKDVFQHTEEGTVRIPPITWEALGYQGRTIIIKELQDQWGSFKAACEEIGYEETWLENWLVEYRADRDERLEWQTNLNSWIKHGIGIPEDYDGPGPCSISIMPRTIHKTRRCLEFLGLVTLIDRIESWGRGTVAWPPEIYVDSVESPHQWGSDDNQNIKEEDTDADPDYDTLYSYRERYDGSLASTNAVGKGHSVVVSERAPLDQKGFAECPSEHYDSSPDTDDGDEDYPNYEDIGSDSDGSYCPPRGRPVVKYQVGVSDLHSARRIPLNLALSPSQLL